MKKKIIYSLPSIVALLILAYPIVSYEYYASKLIPLEVFGKYARSAISLFWNSKQALIVQRLYGNEFLWMFRVAIGGYIMLELLTLTFAWFKTKEVSAWMMLAGIYAFAIGGSVLIFVKLSPMSEYFSGCFLERAIADKAIIYMLILGIIQTYLAIGDAICQVKQ